eukprot:TRINITY_DN11806_c0_g1_i1.p1 TRINITY_DN11806_c0_g1~~TRINITY_DN11806_c0_g1_i1.p1  ORF type:complete len:163 (-),score=43.14 TRINITY_DN11806_c0_g1_i1:653-1141(-)
MGGTRTGGTRTEGTRTEGTRTEGTRTEGTRTEGTRTEGTRTKQWYQRRVREMDIKHDEPDPSTPCKRVKYSENQNMTRKLETEEKMKKKETNPNRLKSRQNQIDLGYNTIGYHQYREQVPKRQRKREQPSTPDKFQVCSKRSFDGQVYSLFFSLFDGCFEID